MLGGVRRLAVAHLEQAAKPEPLDHFVVAGLPRSVRAVVPTAAA